MIEQIDDPKIEFTAALYFLDGHYLFRHKAQGGWANKFVTAADVQAAFTGKEQDSGWLQAGIVRVGQNARGPFFVYSPPAQKAEIWLGDERLTVPLPRTVLLCVGAEAYLFALNETHFSATARALVAPFPNVDGDGRICWGRNAKPAADPARARQTWELFFAAPFNSDYMGNKCASEKTDVRVLLRGLAGKSKFPAAELLVHDRAQTIGEVINRILEVR